MAAKLFRNAMRKSNEIKSTFIILKLINSVDRTISLPNFSSKQQKKSAQCAFSETRLFQFADTTINKRAAPAGAVQKVPYCFELAELTFSTCMC